MRRTAYYTIAAIIIIVSCLCATASLAAESISAGVSVTPTETQGPGRASVTVTIRNGGDPVSGVRVGYPEQDGTEGMIGDMATGETRTYVDDRWEITESMLDKELSFTVFWTSPDGVQRSAEAPPVVIRRQEPISEPTQGQPYGITGTADADYTEVAEGGRVRLSFSMTNISGRAVESASLVAPPIDGGEQIGSAFSIRSGETKRIAYTITAAESMIVSPTFTYGLDGRQYRLELKPIVVTVSKPAEAPAAPAEDAEHNPVAVPTDWQAPAPESLDTARAVAEGAAITDIRLTSAHLSEPGKVKVDATVTNVAQEALRNLTVSDAIIGEIGSVQALEAGGTITLSKAITVDRTSSYEIVTSAHLGNGTPVESRAAITVYVGDGSPTVFTGLSLPQILILAGATILIITVALVIYMNSPKAKVKNIPAGDQKQLPYRGRVVAQSANEPSTKASRVGSQEPRKIIRESATQSHRALKAAVEPAPLKFTPQANAAPRAVTSGVPGAGPIKFGDRSKF